MFDIQYLMQGYIIRTWKMYFTVVKGHHIFVCYNKSLTHRNNQILPW